MTTSTDIAEAFSRHEFQATFEHLADDVEWNNVGGQRHPYASHIAGLRASA